MNSKKLLVGLVLAGFGLNAQAALLDFDDPSLTSGTDLSSYGGLMWSNVRILDPSTDVIFNGSGFANGRVSAPNVAFNLGGSLASLASSSPFVLNSGYFTAASRNGLTIDFVGSASGTTQFMKSVSVDVLAPLLVTFDWAIDLLEISTRCETGCTTPSDIENFGTQFVLDNLRINEPNNSVPEPGMLTLLGSGLLGMAWMRRRKQPLQR